MTGGWRDRRVPPAIGGAALLLCLASAVAAPVEMARAWLVVALVAIGFPLGALLLLMVGELTGGRWGEATRPLLRAIAGTLPLALLAFVPLLFAFGAIFPWAGDPAALSITARHKLGYLNPPGLVLRFVACAVLWLGLAVLLGVWGRHRPRRPLLSGIGLALHAVLLTVFATDWMLSLEPDFYSTVYPMLVAAEQILLVLAVALIAPIGLERPGGSPAATLGEDLARLLVAAVLGWAYLAFMQWVVIWSGDLPEEIGWYLPRLDHGWQFLLWAALLLGLAVPAVGLVGPRGKRDPAWRWWIAAATLAGQVAEGVWRIAPAFPMTPRLAALLLLATLAMAGLGLAAVTWLGGRANGQGGVLGEPH